MVTALITGGSGLLGRYLQRKTIWYNTYLTHLTNPVTGSIEVDITDSRRVTLVMNNIRPDIVIHCAAIGSVDYCENNENEAYAVNVQGAVNVASAAKNIGSQFVFVSSNAVFRGDAAPYNEEDFCNPINVYGKTKCMAEQAVQCIMEDNWLIVRPILLYGNPYIGGRGNWVTRAIEMLGANMPMEIVNDTLTQPTYAGYCAEAIWRLVNNRHTGIYHVGDGTVCSLYEFVRTVAIVYEYDLKLIHPVPSDHFPSLAPRPVNTTYNIEKLLRCGHMMNRLEDGLKEMRNERV